MASNAVTSERPSKGTSTGEVSTGTARGLAQQASRLRAESRSSSGSCVPWALWRNNADVVTIAKCHRICRIVRFDPAVEPERIGCLEAIAEQIDLGLVGLGDPVASLVVEMAAVIARLAIGAVGARQIE